MKKLWIYTILLEQDIKQFWLPEKYQFQSLKCWNELSLEERLYIKTFGGLTLLDTKQANDGVPSMMS